MKDRPIPFSGPMVRAVLAGTKTQTRRVVKPQPGGSMPDGWSWQRCGVEGWYAVNGQHRGESLGHCPYGAPGDRLWVREAWHTHAFLDAVPPRDITTRSIHYAADGPIKTGKRRPGMFMPRWASRITLEIVSVRVERLQDISEADARAEGIHKPVGSQFWHADPHGSSLPGETPQWAYRNLWEKLNGPGSWAANPWVWVVEFRRA